MTAESAVAELVTLAGELIALETTNLDDPAAMGTERVAAEYVAGKLAEVGYDVTYLESDAPGRGNVVARLPGAHRRKVGVHGSLGQALPPSAHRLDAGREHLLSGSSATAAAGPPAAAS